MQQITSKSRTATTGYSKTRYFFGMRRIIAQKRRLSSWFWKVIICEIFENTAEMRFSIFRKRKSDVFLAKNKKWAFAKAMRHRIFYAHACEAIVILRIFFRYGFHKTPFSRLFLHFWRSRPAKIRNNCKRVFQQIYKFAKNAYFSLI